MTNSRQYDVHVRYSCENIPTRRQEANIDSPRPRPRPNHTTQYHANTSMDYYRITTKRSMSFSTDTKLIIMREIRNQSNNQPANPHIHPTRIALNRIIISPNQKGNILVPNQSQNHHVCP